MSGTYKKMFQILPKSTNSIQPLNSKTQINYNTNLNHQLNNHPTQPKTEIDASLNMTWERKHFANTSDPTVWGPSFWFTLHNGAAKYPVNASKIISQRTKGFIQGIPYMLPCADCSEHARAFIDKHTPQLDTITSTRENLFNFYVDFHNYVNKRYNKPETTYEDAWKMFSGDVVVNKLSFN